MITLDLLITAKNLVDAASDNYISIMLHPQTDAEAEIVRQNVETLGLVKSNTDEDFASWKYFSGVSYLVIFDSSLNYTTKKEPEDEDGAFNS